MERTKIAVKIKARADDKRKREKERKKGGRQCLLVDVLWVNERKTFVQPPLSFLFCMESAFEHITYFSSFLSVGNLHSEL